MFRNSQKHYIKRDSSSKKCRLSHFPNLQAFVWHETQIKSLYLGMHNIFRTDKLSTDMGENDVIFIAPINKLNPISRSDIVHLLVNQSISLICLKSVRFPSASYCSLCRTHYVMSSPVWKFFSVVEEDSAIAIGNTCSATIPRRGKRRQVLTTNHISHLKASHCSEAVLRDFKQPLLLER